MGAAAFMISLQFDLTMKLADELIEEAEAVGKISSRDLSSYKYVVSSSWRGENSTAYVRKMDQLEGKITNNAAGLRSSGELIKRMARNIYEAEMRAIAIVGG